MRHITKTHAHGRVRNRGGGMGSVLLSKGGPGAGSSYTSEPEMQKTIGSGLSDKLKKILIRPLAKKGNISFNV